MTKDEALKLLDALRVKYSDVIYYASPGLAAQFEIGIADIKQALEAPVQDSKELFGYEIWGCFYRTFDEALEAFKDKGIQWATSDGVFNGMNEEWVKANIREVYVHGTSALEEREARARKEGHETSS